MQIDIVGFNVVMQESMKRNANNVQNTRAKNRIIKNWCAFLEIVNKKVHEMER